MNDTGWLVLVGIVVLGAAVFMFGGSQEQEPVFVPIVDAGLDVVASECTSIRVGCEGYDPAGGPISYQWTAERGAFDNARVLNPVYTTPSTCGLGETVILTLTVTNEHGIHASDSLSVRVSDTVHCVSTPICCPPANIPCRTPAVMAASRPAVVSHPVVLPQRAPYYTTCPPPPVTVRPAVCAPPCPVPCVTCPPRPVTVRPAACTSPCPVPCALCPPLVPPCPAPCTTSAGCSVVEGGSIQLRGTVCDPDGNLVRYYWTADMGSFDDPWAINPVYCAPLIGNPCGEDVCITLTAIDSCGARATSQIVLRITDTNHPPVVNVGP